MFASRCVRDYSTRAGDSKLDNVESTPTRGVAPVFLFFFSFIAVTCDRANLGTLPHVQLLNGARFIDCFLLALLHTRTLRSALPVETKWELARTSALLP